MTYREFKAMKKRLTQDTYFHQVRMVQVAFKTLGRAIAEAWKFDRLFSRIIKASKKSK